MMIILAYVPIKKDAGKKMLWAVAAFGICIIVFGLSIYFWLSMIMLILSGAFDSISVIVRNTLIHKLTPESMKGRVSAVNSVFVGSSNELGSFESGVLAKVVGTVSAVVIGGMVTLGVVGFTALKAKKLQDLDL
jgi:MFS family permease